MDGSDPTCRTGPVKDPNRFRGPNLSPSSVPFLFPTPRRPLARGERGSDGEPPFGATGNPLRKPPDKAPDAVAALRLHTGDRPQDHPFRRSAAFSSRFMVSTSPRSAPSTWRARRSSAGPSYKKAYVTLRLPLSISPDLFPVPLIQEERERIVAAQAKSRPTVVEGEDGGKGRRH